MEAIVTLIAIVGSLLLLDLFAGAFGVDSRDTLPDDHHR
jgi:hypothetical protein